MLCDILNAKHQRIIPKVRLNLTFLWLFICLFVFNFVFFEDCLKQIPLFQRYMDMYPRVLYRDRRQDVAQEMEGN